jgi:hypothetical protein
MSDPTTTSFAMPSPGGAVTRLSAPTVRKNARRALTDLELADLRRIASALIPAADDAPAGGDITDFDTQAAEALAILDASFGHIERALADLHDCATPDLFDRLRELDHRAPELFYPLSLMITAMYLYSADVEPLHGYPHPHRNPPEPMDAADEIEAGILGPVIDRGPIYVAAP